MCREYKYRQSECGQCFQYHGPKQYTNLMEPCRRALNNGGQCTVLKKKKNQEEDVKRLKWMDCENCGNRDKVHALWIGNPA